MLRSFPFVIICFTIYTNAYVIQHLGLNHASLTHHPSNPPIIRIPQPSKTILHHPSEIISVQPIRSHILKTSSSSDDSDFNPHPRYSFSYDIKDLKTGDEKQQEEKRDGDHVQGKYSLVEPDGTRRIVAYTADNLSGFNAIVSKEPLHGQQNQQQRQQQQQQINEQQTTEITSSTEDDENLEEFRQQLAQHQAEIEEEQRRQREQLRQSVIQQQEELTREQLRQTALKQQQQQQQQEQIARAQAIVLAQSIPSSVLGHTVHSTIVHHHTPTLRLHNVPVLTTNQHISTLETHPTIVKSIGLPRTHILSQHPTTLLQTQFLSSPSVVFTSRIDSSSSDLTNRNLNQQEQQDQQQHQQQLQQHRIDDSDSEIDLSELRERHRDLSDEQRILNENEQNDNGNGHRLNNGNGIHSNNDRKEYRNGNGNHRNIHESNGKRRNGLNGNDNGTEHEIGTNGNEIDDRLNENRYNGKSEQRFYYRRY
ncbi:basic-leucine zipper transcription factor A-like [Condylostylus longicornis]|uniref:basic-leucine zipper transcription factor A-like n=1 Tax=Condylostylus longicornis TaxID=2530218 RepID=UPI00244E5982|nr:basic-leucine zipper transcription factor A-like [Condylostylus longicornis]